MGASGIALVVRGTVSEDRKTVRLEDEVSLAPGTEVLVTAAGPECLRRGSPEAVLAAMQAPPHVTREDYLELMRVIHENRLDVDWGDPFEGLNVEEEAGGC